MHYSRGCAYGKEDINNIIVEHKKKMIIETNHIPLCVQDEVNKNTLSNYVAHIALHGDISINKKAIPKTSTRITAENSSRGSISNVFLVASTHFVEVTEYDKEITKQIRNLPDDTRLLYDLVTDGCTGVPMFPVWPELITSTDEST